VKTLQKQRSLPGRHSWSYCSHKSWWKRSAFQLLNKTKQRLKYYSWPVFLHSDLQCYDVQPAKKQSDFKNYTFDRTKFPWKRIFYKVPLIREAMSPESFIELNKELLHPFKTAFLKEHPEFWPASMEQLDWMTGKILHQVLLMDRQRSPWSKVVR